MASPLQLELPVIFAARDRKSAALGVACRICQTSVHWTFFVQTCCEVGSVIVPEPAPRKVIVSCFQSALALPLGDCALDAVATVRVVKRSKAMRCRRFMVGQY